MNTEFQKIIDFRRSNRSFDPNVPVPEEVIRVSLERAILSPNSSNMQLWEFYWLESKAAIAEMIPLCLGQQAAATAQQMVVFVTRKDKWRMRANWNLERIKETIVGEPNKMQKNGMNYYGKLMPLIYANDPFGFMTFIRRSISFFMGLKKPFPRSGGVANQRVVAHKSCALAAQTFMLSVAAEGFHSCPMEGFDPILARKALGLPKGAELNMIVAVGKGTPEGIHGERKRLPYNDTVIIH
jgi:nitroreductase